MNLAFSKSIRPNWREERKSNIETFGQPSVRRGGFRGGYRGFRGGYNSGYNGGNNGYRGGGGGFHRGGYRGGQHHHHHQESGYQQGDGPHQRRDYQQREDGQRQYQDGGYRGRGRGAPRGKCESVRQARHLKGLLKLQ